MRELWAKLHVEILDDSKLCGRPDSDFRLWIGLILLAKQAGDDGVIHKMGAAALRERLSLQCSSRRVQQALEHFAASGMVKLENGGVRLLNYDKRQAVKDYKEQNAERQRRWRERNVTNNGDVTLGSNGQSRSEEIRRDQIPLKPPQGGATDSHPFRSRKAKAEPYVPNCARCRKDGHSARDCQEPLPEEVPQ